MDQLEIEKKWQAYWKENKTFEATPSEQPKYFGTVPYPYANSALHIGHGRTFTAADILMRFQRLKGMNVLYPLGFHISGTPVLAVADGVKQGDQKVLKLARDSVACYESDPNKVDKIVSTFTEVSAIADYFSSVIPDTFASVGISMDFSKLFSTGDVGYQHFVQWQYRQLEKAGVLAQGKYPILYSYADESAVGEDDIKDGDVEKVTIQEMTYILFKAKEADEYFCVATLRPDALFGATNLWVDPTHTLAKIHVGKQVWIVNNDCLEKFKHQFDDVTVLETISGEELLGKTFLTPLINREVLVASASFIDSKHGTGLVYSSPAGSPHDYLGLVEAKADGRLPETVHVINTVVSKDKEGKIIEWDGSCPAEAMCKKHGITTSTDPKVEDAKQELYKIEHYSGTLNEECGAFAGVMIKHAKEKVFDALKEQQVGGVFYEPSRRAVTRAGNEVIVANLHGQWFLDYSAPETKSKATQLLNDMSYYPANMKATQQGYLDWVQKRPCARKRGIGTPLPQDEDWIVEPLSDSTIYPFYYIIAGFINDGRLKPEEITDDLLEYFYHDGPKPNLAIAEELKEEVLYWKNFDFRYTNPPHMSNHLSFLIYHNALLFDKSIWPKTITVAGLLIKDGAKISKSKGNGIPLIKVREQYGSDLYRLYVAVATSFDAEMDFRDEEIHQLEKKFNRWKELLFAAREHEDVTYEELTDVDKWLVSRFYTRSKEYFAAFENMNMREAYIAIMYEFMNEINYHTRRSTEAQTIKTLNFISADYAKLMTPVVPHVCEELLDGDASLAEFQTLADNYIDQAIEGKEQLIKELLADLDKRIGFAKTKNQELQSIIIHQAQPERFSLFDDLNELLKKETPPKQIIGELMKAYGSSQAKFIPKFVPKTFGNGIHHYFPFAEEKELLEEALEFLEEAYGVSVTLGEPAEGNAALPGRPLVLPVFE